MPKRSKDDPSPSYKRKPPLHGDGRFAESEVIRNDQRICRCCQVWKDFSEFGKSKVGIAGIKANCRTCENELARQRYASGEVAARRKQQKHLYDKARYERRKAEGAQLGGDPVKARARMLRRNYGLTSEAYDAMVESQANQCLICHVSGEDVRNSHLVVDHCHATGSVRGLLCPKCNLLLGHADDTIERLERAILYLRDRGEG